MSLLPPPAIPWQITGNHWIALPCIHPADASIHAVGMLHRGARSAIEFAGGAEFVAGNEPPLARPSLGVDGVRHRLSEVPIAWERALGWIPTFTCTVAECLVRGTIFAPYGRDADVSGAVYALSIENRGGATRSIEVSLDGTAGHRQLRVQTPRPFEDAVRVVRGDSGAVLIEGSSLPGLATLAILPDGDADVEINGANFSIRRTITVDAGSREQVAFYFAVGPERDGAESTATVLRRRGWRELLAATRDAIQALEQTSGNEAIDRLINRNLLFAYFYAVGRALDDAQYYLVRSRVPWNGHGVTVRDWDALSWTIPAVQLADSGLARELLLRMCELHGYAPGRGVHYLDGTLFEPGFALEGVAGYPIATDRYIRDTGDDRVVDEPVLADTLYLAADDLDARRDKRIPLYSTEVSPSGAPAVHPYTLHANATVALALDVLRRTLDEETAKELQDPDAVRAAIHRHFLVEHAAKQAAGAAADVRRQVDLRVVDRSRRRDVRSRRSLGVRVLAADLRGRAATGFHLSSHGEGDRRHAAVARSAVRAAHRARRGERVAVAAPRAARRRPRRRGDRRRRQSGREWRRRVAVRAPRVDGVVRGERTRRASLNRVYSQDAGIAQLVEHNLAKVGVAGSSPVSRSRVRKRCARCG